MSSVVYVSDFFVNEIVGGGELNDNELINLIANNKIDLIKFKSSNINKEILNNYKNNYFIISNFALLSDECKNYLINECKYVIYEHDHKYLKNRNPAIYKDYLAPKDKIINFQFYEKAKAIFCQSNFHKEIIYKNLLIKNIISLSGNLWSLEILNFIDSINSNLKNESYAILNSNVEHKNTLEAIKFCNYKNLRYDLVSDNDCKSFLLKLNRNKGLVFLPKTPETLSRLAVESRMLNLETICNKNVGATYEEWFSLKGNSLVDYMIKKREIIYKIVLEKLIE